jgi:hypothetical protein
MGFARWVFAICGIYGIVALIPLYFMEASSGKDYPPPITHPEFYYATIGVALAWQVAFLIISVDPRRFRPIMLTGVLEKLGFGVPAVVLYCQGRSSAPILYSGSLDLLMGAIFLAAYFQTAPRPATSAATPVS